LHDAYQTTGALLQTGADTNGDGRADSYPNKNTDGTGYPNPYDMDSDGDGLSDMVEAGFTGTGGIVAGTKGADGWSATIKALSALNLLNTDGTGPVNYMDLDSDDDGIGDNYEWQTGVHIASTNVDTDNDGLADVYDSSPNTFGGAKTAADSDGDGRADYIDLDSDNDGITDIAEWQLRTAYIAPVYTDSDNDGIMDVYDTNPGSFGGANVPVDADGDGVADYKDKDSDNDGIADVVEAFGVDTNGDGEIDGFVDTDGDGVAQIVDANNTGYAGSGVGLGYVDLENDGIPNNRDLDSDDDGIPDILEVYAADTNNDGRVDNFTDANNNGWHDAFENGNSLLITGADTNADGRADSYPFKNFDYAGKPNPYSLDSDGDGIADAVEAGFTGSVSITNGMVTGATTNGWANSVRAITNGTLTLRNTDGRGRPNYLDIDSDDDGISDNVEGQPTFSFVVKSDADTDGDGIPNVYDINPNTWGGNGITPFDFDSDGIPDYMDSDTDNDGAPDINEASALFTLNQSNVNTADTDGDGLLDQYDNVDIRTLVDGNRYLNVSNSNMGPNGNFHGPTPTGSNVKVMRSLPTGDRDWRTTVVLPLRIVHFGGVMNDRIVNLLWKVENEGEVDHYVVERSTDGIAFSSIAKVKAKGGASNVYTYADDIKFLTSPVVYYRVIQMNRAGNQYQTNIIMFKLDRKQMYDLKVYPNPFMHVVNVKLFSPVKDQAEVVVFDAGGKSIVQKKFNLEIGQNSLSIPEVSTMAHGTYLLVVKTKEETWSQKLIKQ
jgi:hypothetical protein